MNRSKNLIIILIIIIVILIVALAGAIVYIVMDKEETSNNKKVANNTQTQNEIAEENDEEYFDEDDLREEVTDKVNDFAVQTFNMNFTSYEGTECSAAQIKSLLSLIKTSNSASEHIVNLNTTGITASEQVKSDKKYNVELSYDNEGYVNEILISEASIPSEDNEEQTTADDMAKAMFNSKFMPYLGQITGTQLNSLLQTIKTSNDSNPEHQIGLTSNNMQSLNGIVATDSYVITFAYDTIGYINNVNIDKKI